jgi:hypothetical protein
MRNSASTNPATRLAPPDATDNASVTKTPYARNPALSVMTLKSKSTRASVQRRRASSRRSGA